MAFQNNSVSKSGLITTFSGSDIKCVFGNVEVGNLQGISWSVNREVRPIFVCGEPNALSYSKNKRGVAGSMVLTVFDRGALFDIMTKWSQVYRDDQTFHPGITETEGHTHTMVGARQAYYADEIPPFNISLYGQNEFNKQMKMGIVDVTIISEGAGISIDDGIQEAQFTYVARHVLPWRPLQGADSGTDVSMTDTVFNDAFTINAGTGEGDTVDPCTAEEIETCATGYPATAGCTAEPGACGSCVDPDGETCV
tara:strand:+ start:2261 stop:3019 length:759 start_codon:yes stop_codon:yes gene_type:complete